MSELLSQAQAIGRKANLFISRELKSNGDGFCYRVYRRVKPKPTLVGTTTNEKRLVSLVRRLS